MIFWAIAFLSFGVQPSRASIPPTLPGLQRVEKLSGLAVGESIEKIADISRDRMIFRKDEAASFYIYYFKPTLSRYCFNLECGTFAGQILARGGRLMGSSNGKYFRQLGVSVETENPRARPSILIVTDSAGKVRRIYQDVSSSDLPGVLDSLEK